MDAITQSQIAVCLKYGADFLPLLPGAVVGAADNVIDTSLLPINGLRHPPEGRSCGWYIWRGKSLSLEPDFFKPVRVEDLVKRLEIERFLALSPGWRFLLAPGSEDVWQDPELLKV